MPNHRRGAPLGNKRRAIEGPKRKPFPARIREDLIDALSEEAVRQGRKIGEVAEEAFTQYKTKLLDSAGNEIRIGDVIEFGPKGGVVKPAPEPAAPPPAPPDTSANRRGGGRSGRGPTGQRLLPHPD